MAIKVLDIGQGINEVVTVQDFLMTDNPNFFSPDIVSYNEFLGSEDLLKFFFPGFNPFDWRFREFSVALKTLKEPEESPLQMQFFSNTAYRFGPHNIKFTAKPCHPAKFKNDLNKNNPDYLKSELQSRLGKEEACFLFEIQLQDPAKNMPLEDPSIEWEITDSPTIPVARVTILKQEFDTDAQIAFCENLSFSPWNTLLVHQPLGQFNRIRKHVYKASSDYRHAKNKTSTPVDLDW